VAKAKSGRFEIEVIIKVDEIEATDPPNTVRAEVFPQKGETNDREPDSARDTIRELVTEAVAEAAGWLED